MLFKLQVIVILLVHHFVFLCGIFFPTSPDWCSFGELLMIATGWAIMV